MQTPGFHVYVAKDGHTQTRAVHIMQTSHPNVCAALYHRHPTPPVKSRTPDDAELYPYTGKLGLGMHPRG